MATFAEPVPPWVRGCDDAALRRVAGSGAWQRGRQYAMSGAVVGLEVGPDGTVSARVRGSDGRAYRTAVAAGRRGAWTGTCTCPIGWDCKHCVALLLTARSAEPEPQRVAVPPRPPWERRLAALVEEPDEAASGRPLALALELGGDGQVRLRPLRPGAKSGWVRSGATWRELPYATGFDARQREAVLALHRALAARQPQWYGVVDTVSLADVGPAAVQLLAAARTAGVVLLDPERDRQVRLVPGAVAVHVDLTRDDAAVVLRAAVELPEAEGGSVVLLGRPAFGLLVQRADALVLGAFAAPLDPAAQALLTGPPLHVPVEDLPQLRRRWLPALARRLELRSSDGSVDLVQARPPVLGLHVHYGPQHAADLAWGFRYAFGDEEVVTVAVDGGGDVARDRGAERLLLAGLPPLPGLRTGVELTTRTDGLATALLTTELLPALREHGVAVEVSGQPADYRESDLPPVVEITARDDPSGRTDWFDVAVSVRVGQEQVLLAVLIAALAAGQTKIVLPSGTVVRIDRPELAALRQLVEEARGLVDVEAGTVRMTALQAGLWEELVALGVVREQSERWERQVRGLLDLDLAPPAPVPGGLQAQMRPYQQDGYRWLAQLWDLGLGGVLADDMGLGKTLQVLALALRARDAGLAAPLLVVAPTSVVGAWCEQAARWAPGLRVVAVGETSRRSGTPVAERARAADVVVTSYALLRLDAEQWLDLSWGALVLDEAQHVKNPASVAYSVARRLVAPVKLAVTGTPLENSLLDLWALLSIVAPGLFPDREHFERHFRRPVELGTSPERLAVLRRRVRPLLLRRTKEQVAADLPGRVEQVVEVALSPQHRKAYDRQLQRERQRLLGLLDDMARHRFTVFKSLTVLRQLALDPVLVGGPAVPTAKIDVLAGMLAEVAREGHRALVFSSFTGFLGRVRERLDADGLRYCYLDGRTRDRARRVQEFREGDAPAFLISLKAGGTGLTLTEADYVFVLDPWWNPAAEAQAVDRAHRIGQTRTVMVYRLVAADTVEQKVLALQERKRALFDAVVAGGASASGALTAEDVRSLLA